MMMIASAAGCGSADETLVGEASDALAPVNDLCPGTTSVLDLGQSITLTDSTIGATDDYTSFCADATTAADTPDVVFAFTLLQAGVLTLHLDDHLGANQFNGAFSIRKVSCTGENAKDECANRGPTDETTNTDLAAGTYYVIVDGVNQASGDFTLQASLAAPVCGDGIVSSNSATEQCDLVPTNAKHSKVCNPPGHAQQCQYVAATNISMDTCPGVPRNVTFGAGLEVLSSPSANTCPLADDYLGTCAGGNTDARDAVHRLVADAPGTLTVTVGNDIDGLPACSTCGADCPESCGLCFVPILYARKGACDGPQAVEVACAFDPTFATTVATITIPITEAGENVWIFVDSDYDGPYTAGPYFLETTLQ